MRTCAEYQGTKEVPPTKRALAAAGKVGGALPGTYPRAVEARKYKPPYQPPSLEEAINIILQKADTAGFRAPYQIYKDDGTFWDMEF